MNFQQFVYSESSSRSEDSAMSSMSSNTSPRSDVSFYEQDCFDTTTTCLRIIEQPINKFRFRYKSEMSGTHGSLNGASADRNKKQTYPKVELLNFPRPAVIRCTLYQYSDTNQQFCQPHPNRLVKKVNGKENDDPHEENVSKREGYVATFHSMGIIHTAKRDIVTELVRKKKAIKLDEIAPTRPDFPHLTPAEEKELHTQAESECQSINLNIVCLRFDAFEVINNIKYPICKPVYSCPIYNLKSALTGDLKIVRMDRCFSQACGQAEVFLLVEKVTKKNIKIRLYELDDRGECVWENFGIFNDVDVHHQFAIVFRTPPYKDENITEPRKVFIELLRPSDGATSEPKDFTYVPVNNRKGNKRARYAYSSDYSTSGEFSSSELPIVIQQQNQFPNAITDEYIPQVDSKELDEIIKQQNFTIDDPDSLFEKFGKIQDLFSYASGIDQDVFACDDNFTTDGHKQDSSPLETKENKEILQTTQKNLTAFLKTQPKKADGERYIRQIFEKKKNSENSNVLHLCVQYKTMAFLKWLLDIMRLYQVLDLIDHLNSFHQTPLHLAIIHKNKEALIALLNAGADIKITDKHGYNILHLAVLENDFDILNIILDNRNVKEIINEKHHNGHTALILAVKMCLLSFTEKLCENGADVNILDQTNGRTCLHIAILDENVKIVKYLLEKPDLDMCIKDYNGYSPYRFAKLSNVDEILTALHKAMEERGILIEAENIKLEEDEMQLDTPSTVFIKEEPERERLESLYNAVNSFEETTLIKISEILDKSIELSSLLSVLQLDHMSSVLSTTKSVLEYVGTEQQEMWHLRNGLENLGEMLAVLCLDEMVLNMPK